MITYLLDRMRISFGDSKCPLAKKCRGYDNEQDSCVTYRGRNEIGGDRTQCYEFFKADIRIKKQSLISKVGGKIMVGFMQIGGIKEK